MSEAVARRIQAELKRHGENYADMARVCGVTPPAARKWALTGKLTDGNLDTLAAHWGVTSEFLRYGGSRKPQVSEELLAVILGSIENQLSSAGLELPTNKRAHLAALVYRLVIESVEDPDEQIKAVPGLVSSMTAPFV